MLGDDVDYGTAASRQSQASGIRTDRRTIIIQELLELWHVETHQQGYQADSSTYDDSSEGSFNTTTGQGNQQQDSRLLRSLRWPSTTRQRGQWWTVQEALQKQGPTNYVGIHLHCDFGLILNEKNSDLVCIGYANIDGFPANVIGNEKVNAIRQYAWKHDLDAFFGVEENISWKKMPKVIPRHFWTLPLLTIICPDPSSMIFSHSWWSQWITLLLALLLQWLNLQS